MDSRLWTFPGKLTRPFGKGTFFRKKYNKPYKAPLTYVRLKNNFGVLGNEKNKF
jgi:hypothetical protein